MDRVAGLRDEHTRAGLAEADASADPVGKFRAWFEDALAANVREPSAATLATSDGKPSARVVLLKGHDRRGSVSCRATGSAWSANASWAGSAPCSSACGQACRRVLCEREGSDMRGWAI